MKQFNLQEFNLWLQDNHDMSRVNTQEAYLALKVNLCIDYCLNELKMYKVKALLTTDGMYNSELKRLGV